MIYRMKAAGFAVAIPLLLSGCTSKQENVLARFPIYEQCIPEIKERAKKLDEYRAAGAGDASIELQFFTMKSDADPTLVGMGILTGSLVTDAFITTEIELNGIGKICLPNEMFRIKNDPVGMLYALAQMERNKQLGINNYVSLDKSNITVYYNSEGDERAKGIAIPSDFSSIEESNDE